MSYSQIEIEVTKEFKKDIVGRVLREVVLKMMFPLYQINFPLMYDLSMFCIYLLTYSNLICYIIYCFCILCQDLINAQINLLSEIRLVICRVPTSQLKHSYIHFHHTKMNPKCLMKCNAIKSREKKLREVGGVQIQLVFLQVPLPTSI